jgi:hypothetical protein
MPYYMGDYYAAGYRGDPGFLSFLGKAASAIGGFIPGVGPLISAAGSAIERIGTKAAPAALPAAAGAAASATGIGTKMVKGALKHPVLTGAGIAGIAGAAGALAHKELSKRTGRKRRRMRATNPKALRRALRRAYAFERIAMRTIKLVHPRKVGRFGGFKRAKKRVC